MKITIKAISYLMLITLFFACTPKDSDSNESFENTENEEQVIKGTATQINYGKDGYTTKIVKDNGSSLKALVSIPNVGGMENYTSLEEGDFATLKGEVIKVGAEQQMIVRKIIHVRKKTTSLLIKENSFQGISPGDKITSHSSKLEKNTLKNGEGEFVSYQIKDNKLGTVGYLLPDPNDATLVGNITVESDEAKTKKGIRIGSTFGELMKKYPKAKVHGSEIEGRTYAKAGDLSFRLNTSFYSYDVDITKVSKSTEVIEILINR